MSNENSNSQNSPKNKKAPLCRHEFLSEKVIGIYHRCFKDREYTFVIQQSNCARCGKFIRSHISMTEDNSRG